MDIKDRFILKHADDKLYSVSDITFDAEDNIHLPNGVILFSKDKKRWSSTFKLCVNELKNTGKIVCKICGAEALYFRKDFEISDKDKKAESWHFYTIKNNEFDIFSKDHIIPNSLNEKFMGSLGTLNDHYRITCERCNQERGNDWNNLSNEEKTKQSKIVKRMKWIKSSFFFDARKNILQKNKEYKSSMKTFEKFIDSNLKNYVSVIEANDNSFNFDEIRMTLNSVNESGNFQSEKDKDFFDLFINKKYEYKNETMVETILKFQYLIFKDFQERVFTF